MPKFLLNVEAEEIQDSELKQLEEAVVLYRELADEIERREEELKSVKQSFQNVSQTTIPNLLFQHGISELKLRDKSKVIVKEDAQVSVPDDKKPAFFEFLKSRDEEDIIKLQVQFKKMPVEKQQALFDFLNAGEYEYDSERGVHPMTLKAYFKRLLGIGSDDRAEGIAEGRYLRAQDVVGVANVFTFFSTKIK